MIRRLLPLALLALARPALAQDERPTGYPRSANERAGRPVNISAVYTADIRGNVDGGVERGARYLDNFDLQVAIDADRLVGWRGARLFFYGIYDNGVSLSRLVGDVQTVSNIETSVQAARLFEAWVEQDVGRNASVKVGLYNLNSEFDTTQSGGLFLLSSHGIGPDFSQSGRNGPSIFPVTSLAVRGEVKLGEHWLGRVAVLDGVPGDPDHPRRTAIRLSARDGALVVGEVDYLKGGPRPRSACGATPPASTRCSRPRRPGAATRAPISSPSTGWSARARTMRRGSPAGFASGSPTRATMRSAAIWAAGSSIPD